MGKVEERRIKLIEYISERPSYTQKELADKLGVSIRTIKGDFEYLQIQGIDLSRKFRKETPDKIIDTPIIKNSEDVTNAISVLYQLSTKDQHIDEIADSYKCNVSRATLFRKIIPYLSENALIKKENHYLTNNLVFFTSLPDDIQDIMGFAIFCLSTGHNFGKHIYEQSLHYLNGKNLIIHSKQETEFNKLPFYLQVLKKCSSEKSPICFIYRRKPIHFFYLGFIAYSRSKDALYLVGRTKPTKMEFRVFKADFIEWKTVTPVDEPNFRKALQNRKQNLRNIMTCYFKKIQVEMFDISEDKLEYVEVRIHYSPDNYYEIQNLYQSRKKQWERFDKEVSSININQDFKTHKSPKIVLLDNALKECGSNSKQIKYILYSDYIRGISNFANYLRTFKNDVQVLENDNLRKILKQGAQRAIDHYLRNI